MSILEKESQPGAHPCAAGCASGSSRLVIRDERGKGENPEQEHTALIDWLAFTMPYAEGRGWQWMRQALVDIFNIPEKSWCGSSRKWLGYQHRVDLMYPIDGGESILIGVLGWGGEYQRGTIHVSLNGTGCARMQDWALIEAWGESIGGNITRVDCAHDDFEGKTVNIASALAWYRDGAFTNGGRSPEPDYRDDLDSGRGKTFYVGNRKNGKLCRVYEKGRKEGDPLSPWVRVEVEWHNQGRIIPWDILTRPGDYLAGAYPCLTFLSDRQDRIRTIQQSASINYERMVEWLKTAGGRALNVMLQVEGGNAEAVLAQVRRDGAPKRLKPYAGLPDAIPGKCHENAEP